MPGQMPQMPLGVNMKMPESAERKDQVMGVVGGLTGAGVGGMFFGVPGMVLGGVVGFTFRKELASALDTVNSGVSGLMANVGLDVGKLKSAGGGKAAEPEEVAAKASGPGL